MIGAAHDLLEIGHDGPQQFARSDFTVDPPTTGVSPYSSVLLHGATTGLEARW